MVATISLKGTRKLKKSLGASGKKLPREVAVVINKMMTPVIKDITKDIRADVAAPARLVKKSLRAGIRATKTKLGRTLTINVTKRIALRDLGRKPSQNKRGVKYTTSPKKGRQFIPGAFMGPTPKRKHPSGHVRKRKTKGRDSDRILYGPSPWGVFTQKKMLRPTLKRIRRELKKQMRKRIEFNVLKQSGLLKG